MPATVADMMNRVRTQSDMTDTAGFITNANLLEFLNAEWYELYNLVISKFGEDYASKEGTVISVVSGTKAYSLPSDFRTLRGVDLDEGLGTRKTLGRYMWEDRNNDPEFLYETVLGSPTGYALFGSSIYLIPTPDASASLYLWYVPTAAKLNNPAGAGELDTLPSYILNGWDNYIVEGATERVHLKQQDVEMAAKHANKKEMVRRDIIELAAKVRDANRPREVNIVRRRRRF